jgi:hypothetical protein
MEGGRRGYWAGSVTVCVRLKLISSVYTSVILDAQRVLSFVSSRWNWVSPTPTLAWGEGMGSGPIPTLGHTLRCSRYICTLRLEVYISQQLLTMGSIEKTCLIVVFVPVSDPPPPCMLQLKSRGY